MTPQQRAQTIKGIGEFLAVAVFLILAVRFAWLIA